MCAKYQSLVVKVLIKNTTCTNYKKHNKYLKQKFSEIDFRELRSAFIYKPIKALLLYETRALFILLTENEINDLIRRNMLSEVIISYTVRTKK